MRKRKIGKRIVAWMLASSMFLQTSVTALATEPVGESPPKEQEQVTETVPITEQEVPPEVVVEEPSTETAGNPVYENGVIYIDSFAQLCLIGSDSPLLDGEGNPIQDASGNPVSYGLDAAYQLRQDIEVPAGEIWKIPEGFTGCIQPATSSEYCPVYDEQRDAILLYHPYQLETMQLPNAAEQPVLDGDGNADTFGVGQLLYPKGTEQPFLTYSTENRYIISANFSSQLPEKPETVATEQQADQWGRDFPGQVIKTIGEETYILIGNEEQLQAIGTDANVYTPVYQAKKTSPVLGHWEVDKGQDGKPIILYGGDADLLQIQNGKKDYPFGKIEEAIGSIGEIVGRCGVNQTTGEIDPNMDIENSGQKYTNDANYIIFRDLDLQSKNWTPMNFSGKLLGAKAQSGTKLWDEQSSVLTSTNARPVISNVTIVQDTPLEVDKQMGVGFFSTISNEVNSNNIGVSAGRVEVKNIEINGISVSTATSETKETHTLVGGLLSVLGDTVVSLLNEILKILTLGKVDIKGFLTSILDVRNNDPTKFATGAFAGRIHGDVLVEDCVVKNVTVNNINNYTGGFVGFSEGVTEYDGLSKVLGGITDLLTNLLNIIPGLGLGDLITVLLEHVISVNDLIPTGYYNPVIQNCAVENVNGTVGKVNTSYNGGFIGAQVGTRVTGCEIRGTTLLNVEGDQYTGGFAGLSRDAEIKGLLTDVGVELVRVAQPQSLQWNCTINVPTVKVDGQDYVGGFTGAYANSYAVNDTIQTTESLQIHATKNYAGGFAGLATVGWISNLGSGDVKEHSLLFTVKGLLTELLSSNPGKAQMLLSLIGIQPSAIMGCRILGQPKGSSIQATDYAGGFIGSGDGLLLTASSQEQIGKLPPWKWWENSLSGIPEISTVESRVNSLESLQTVETTQSFAGGVMGFVGTASVTGLLNKTLGIGNYLGFQVEDVTVTGTTDGINVVAKGEYAGGAFGLATGGTIKNVHVTNLGSVQALNYAGGFAGRMGPGSLASTGGLTVGILGLNHLIKLSNLLALGQGVEVKATDCSVTGISSGCTVQADGASTGTEVITYTAGGFLAHSNSTDVTNCHVNNVLRIHAPNKEGAAGGFVGVSETGGLAEVGEKEEVAKLLEVSDLLGAIGYLIPSYINCTTTYIQGQGCVEADIAGGFAGKMLSGEVNNSEQEQKYAVFQLDHVTGGSYAGGFGGILQSGALADAAGGISILGDIKAVQLTNLLEVVQAYIPKITSAGVYSEKGFTVTAEHYNKLDACSGSAGGYAGYLSGARIKDSHVNQLRYTTVEPPKELNGTDGTSYYDTTKSHYAVSAIRNAGGYVGRMDIGSSASLGKGLGALGNLLGINDALQALDVVASKIQSSNVYGAPGGYAVKADGTEENSDQVGNAGGYAGSVYGSQFQDCNAYNFSYIIGRESAGGYAGRMEPGNVASVVNDAKALDGLLDVDGNLVQILQSFIPIIYNSETTCVPCGGVVRADAPSDTGRARGLAGGYVGYNLGGRIEGMSQRTWDGQPPIVQRENAVYRLRSVYGYEYAGGFSGRTSCANVADTGNIQLLFGLITLANPLQAVSAVYPTETSTAIYGPLRGLSIDVWNQWVDAVGVNGGYGPALGGIGNVTTQEKLDELIQKYAYGYEILAGRNRAGTLSTQGGAAGGYVGRMDGGVITKAKAMDMKQVQALRTSGGFVGEMMTGGVANVGGLNLAGIDVIGSLPVLQTFVPNIQESSVLGYQSGGRILATGTDHNNKEGHAGGYAGLVLGGQIWGTESMPCKVTGLRQVRGTNSVGGFAGSILPGSALTVDVASNSGLLSGILGNLLTKSNDLASVLNATVSTVRNASVEAWDSWGLEIDGAYTVDQNPTTMYASTVGGFAGTISGAVLGERKATTSSVSVTNVKRVVGGEHAGGFFGLADVSALAQVGDNSSKPILGLIKLGEVDVLDTFRTYIYHGKVTGSTTHGLSVESHTEKEEGTLQSKVYTGNAGGFGGSLLDGSVKNSEVEGLAYVAGKNYCGGFVGHMGRSGAIDLDKAATGGLISGLLNATAGVMDNFGSHVEDSKVAGRQGGYEVHSQGGKDPMAGGFAGYTDLAKIYRCQAKDLKLVESNQIAGGFAGKTSFSYLAEIDAGSAKLLDPVFAVVTKLLDLLYIDELENVNAIEIEIPGLSKLLKLELLKDGKLLGVTLLGLDITVELVKNAGPDGKDLAKIGIGDSYIELPCSKINGKVEIEDKDKENLKLSLIKSNRTTIGNCQVSGIDKGYDVYGGGATYEKDGTHEDGYAGGFIGFNVEGMFRHNDMFYADTIRGKAQKVGPFTGVVSLESKYDFNTIQNIEGVDNKYRVYRDQGSLDELFDGKGTLISTSEIGNPIWNVFPITHIVKVDQFQDFKGAVLRGGGEQGIEAEVYQSSAKAVLMKDQKVPDYGASELPVPPEMQDPCDEMIRLTINKVWKDVGNWKKNRPENITLHLTRFYKVGAEEKKDEIFAQEITMSGPMTENTWQMIVKDLPAYRLLDDNTKAYYRYEVSETPIPGYDTTIETSDDGFTITIVNKLKFSLPETGGRGTMMFTVVGLVGILAILYFKQRRKRNEKVH